MSAVKKARPQFAEQDPALNSAESKSSPAEPVHDRTCTFRDIESQAVAWLWPGWVPLGKVTIMAGAAEVGKTIVLLDLAARVSAAGLMPDDSQGCAGNVVILSSEDGIKDTIRPRLEAAAANLDRIINLGLVFESDQELPVEVPAVLSHVEAVIQKRDARLLIIDPFPAFLSAGKAHMGLVRLSRIAERQRCAIIFTAARKGILSQARTGLLAAQDPDDDQVRILAVAKSNLSVKPQALQFKIEPAGASCRVGWHGTSAYLANQLLGPVPTKEKREAKAEAKTKVQQAMEILQDLLPTQVRQCKQMAARAGFSARTVERAAKELGVKLTYFPTYGGERIYNWSLTDPKKSLIIRNAIGEELV